MPERWTQVVLRHRLAVLACWAIVLAGGLTAATQLPSLLVNSFAIPGTESDQAAKLLATHFGERPESTFVVVFPVTHSSDAGVRRRLQARLDAAARAVPTGSARELRRGGGILYGEVVTRLGLPEARDSTDRLRRALRAQPGPRGLVTGQPAIQRDLDPVLAADLRRGEALAVLVALAVLLVVFGFSRAVAIPFVFAAFTISGTLLCVYAIAHLISTTSYVTNLVVLIGFGLAVDYSLLVVHRYREELANGLAPADAAARTMTTAGRTVVFSGTAVAIGLGLLLFVPVPFIRSMGVGAMFVPLVSIAGALTLQPVLLSLLGARGRPARSTAGNRLWGRLARWVVRRRVPVLVASTALLVALALPVVGLQLVPGSFSGIPASTEAARALELLTGGVGPGAVTPAQVVIDARAPGAVRRAPVRRAVRRLADELFHDPEVLLVASGAGPPYTSGAGRYARVIVVGRHEYGAEQTQKLVRRLRSRLVPEAGFPAGVSALAGGAPPQGVDFLTTTYDAFPWLVLAVALVTYATLLLAFRSAVLPLATVLLNALTVAAVYGVLVVAFGDVEGWIPVFLFATLFGLSMDYQVFLVMRMRETWDRGHDTDAAVERGLERTGRIVTAAALIMAGAFSGFVAGGVPGLRELGVGLSIAVLLDATIVRMLLVPSLVSVLGRRSWWLPGAGREHVPSAAP